MTNLVVTILNLLLALGIFGSLKLAWPVGLSLILFLLWLALNSFLASQILIKIFSLPKIFIKILGVFTVIILLGFTANIFTAWLAFNNFFFLLSLVITGLVLFFWSKIFTKVSRSNVPDLAGDVNNIKVSNLFIFSLPILLIIGWALIFSAVTGDYLSSPWQVISPWYLLASFLALLIIFALAFSRRSLILTIIVIIAVSLMIHSYSLVYQEGFGGDRWRHLGSENRILQELPYQPTLLTDNLWQKNILGINIPQALIAGPKLSYGFEW